MRSNYVTKQKAIEPIKEPFNGIHESCGDRCSWTVPSKGLPHRVHCCVFIWLLVRFMPNKHV